MLNWSTVCPVNVLEWAQQQQRLRVDEVIDWRQEDYHGGCQYLLVTHRDGSILWEKWQWHSSQTNYESAPEMLDKLAIAGLEKLELYRVIFALAKCVCRGHSYQDLKNGNR